jgi:hypothetical protein
MNGLIILEEWLDLILNGRKTWEIRNRNAKIRGQIALIQKGSGLIIGVCDLIDVKGPLSVDELEKSIDKHQVPIGFLRNALNYKKTYAWVLTNARRLRNPKPYKHPLGAVIWVKLPYGSIDDLENNKS